MIGKNLLVMCKNSHLSKLKGSCHVLDHLIRLLMSYCKRVLSASELIVRYSRISSAYNLIFEVTFRGILFTKHKKYRG